MKRIALTALCELNMGQSPESSTYNEAGKGLPFYQGNADFGEVHPETRVWCTSPTRVANAGDILISVRAPIGAMNISTEQCCIGRGLAALTPIKGKCHQQYLYYALQSQVERLIAQGTGSTFKAIGKKVLESTYIPAYSLEEQAGIVSKLQVIDSAIQQRREQQRLLDQLVKSRFIEMFGDSMENSKALPVARLGDLSEIVAGITKGRKTGNAVLRTVPYMAVSNVKDGYIDWTTVKTIDATEAEIARYRLKPYDVLMTEGGDPDKLGRGAIIIDPPLECIHQNHVFRVRLDTNAILPAYFAQYLQHEKAKRYFLGCAKQTTGIASINMKQLHSLPVILPSIAEQRHYSNYLAQVDKSKVEIQKALDKLEMLKKSLMQQYFG